MTLKKGLTQEEKNEYARAWYARNRERNILRQREYRAKNKERVNATNRRWRARHPEKARHAAGYPAATRPMPEFCECCGKPLEWSSCGISDDEEDEDAGK